MKRNDDTPAHLEPPEVKLFDRIKAEYGIQDGAGLELLTSACESRGRARRCRELIDAQGELTAKARPHPLLAAERDARRAFVATIRELGLDLESAGQVGAPIGNSNRLQRVK
jgi:phage terminase small subunit